MSERFPYEDLYQLPHHVSRSHPRMPAMDRAAQFSPFAALTGHEAAISETARFTDERPELDELMKEQLDQQLAFLNQVREQQPEITVTLFVPDERKSGGSFQTVTGRFARIDAGRHRLVFADGKAVSLAEICELGCELFDGVTES